MKRLILVFAFLPLMGLAKSNRVASSAEADLRTEYKPRSVYGRNFMGIEVLGRGVLYTLTYDRAVTSRFSVGAGLSYYQFKILGMNVDIGVLIRMATGNARSLNNSDLVIFPLLIRRKNIIPDPYEMYRNTWYALS